MASTNKHCHLLELVVSKRASRSPLDMPYRAFSKNGNATSQASPTHKTQPGRLVLLIKPRIRIWPVFGAPWMPPSACGISLRRRWRDITSPKWRTGKNNRTGWGSLPGPLTTPLSSTQRGRECLATETDHHLKDCPGQGELPHLGRQKTHHPPSLSPSNS